MPTETKYALINNKENIMTTETKYALINNDIVVNVIVCEDPEFIKTIEPDYQHIELLDTPEEQKVAGPGWLWDPQTNTFSPPPPPPPVEVWVIPNYEFRARFTYDQRVAVYTLARTDVAVQVLVADMDNFPQINLQAPETISGVNSLVTAGILTQAEADVILAPVIQEG